MKRTFKSLDSSQEIHIKICKENAYFWIEKFNHESYKLFLMLLKDIIEFLKNKNISYIKLFVSNQEVSLFENYEEIIQFENEYYLFQDFLDNCPSDISIVKFKIDNFPENIYKVLGIY